MLMQVVLPDPSNAQKDTVVFLDKVQAAPTSEEAQERAAVAALARVAGHRNMQRVLPQAFQAAWAWCVQQVCPLQPPIHSHWGFDVPCLLATWADRSSMCVHQGQG